MTESRGAMTRTKAETFSSFGTWLRRQIELREMSQSDFARRSGVTTGMVSQWILGRRRPNPENIEVIADALRVDVNEVLAAMGLGYMPKDDPPEVRRVIDLLRRVSLTKDREDGLTALLETWITADERRRMR